ncbi:MAG: hypothetical protein M1834_007963 [Cirrosporium novae-zelandiae]|nr:MAG: hypothetical protein M1834_007963 [Cirrosporium novae-zelandiae]
MDQEAKILHSQISTTLDLPPSCIEFCPAAPNLFVVGTYFLDTKPQQQDNNNSHGEEGEAATKPPDEDKDEEEVQTGGGGGPTRQKRSGSLILFELDGIALKLCQTLPTPSAVLDMHFCKDPLSSTSMTILATAQSTGSVAVYSLDLDEKSLTCLKVLQLFSEDLLVLYFTWMPPVQGSESRSVAVTLSTGEIAWCEIGFSESGSRVESGEVRWTYQAHSLEAWFVTCSSEPVSRLRLYSGGDDSLFCMHALEGASQELPQHSAVMMQDRKTHGAGVTAILPLPVEAAMDGQILLTGSYDNVVRVIDPFGRPRVLAEETLDGGVWRLKLIEIGEGPRETDGRSEESKSGSTKEARFRGIVLASCMHAGTRILEIINDAEGTWSIWVLAKFEEHQSMNYGSDVQPCGQPSGSFVCASTSFYDKKLCVWKYEKESAC